MQKDFSSFTNEDWFLQDYTSKLREIELAISKQITDLNKFTTHNERKYGAYKVDKYTETLNEKLQELSVYIHSERKMVKDRRKNIYVDMCAENPDWGY
jgi:hypothetical protein